MIYIFLEYFLPDELVKNYNNFEYSIEQINIASNNESIIKYFDNFSDNPQNNIIINAIKNIDINNRINYFKLLILYLKGGIIINDKIVIKTIEKIQDLFKNEDLCLVKSLLFDTFFDGFIIAKPNNKIILNTLIEYIENNVNKIDIMKLLYKNVTDSENNAYKILNEKIIDNISYLYYHDNTIVIAEHHYTKNNFTIINTIKKSQPYNLNKLNIGITIDIPTNLKAFYSNGIRQNSLYFFELLKNMGYNVKLIVANHNEKIIDEIGFYKYDYISLHNILLENFDVIFSFGFSLPKNLFSFIKKLGIKIVGYFCGNAYVIDSEMILYSQHKKNTINYEHTNDDTYDIIWSIPQMYKQNKCYWEIIHRTKCIEIPFIWSPSSIEFIKQITNVSDADLMYKQKTGKIAIFEPNISIMKWCVPCILISELTYRKYHNITHLYVTNINTNKQEESVLNSFNIKELNNMCKPLELFKDKKLSIESRYITLDFMKTHADIAVSHQWDNPLNYLYFDLAWMGWPILHNASLCKNIGYYYDEFNYDDASDKLNDIIQNHNKIHQEYIENNRKNIETYLPTNILLQHKYRKLINQLFI